MRHGSPNPAPFADSGPAQVPRVARLSVTPVKSLALHHPEAVFLERCGVAENRRFYLIREDGRLLAGIHHGPLVSISATWDAGIDRLRFTFPDGGVIEEAIRLGESVRTDIWGREVTGNIVEGPWADALTSFAGKPIRLVKANDPGGGIDAEPITVVSAGSIAELARQAGREAVDSRRFRALIEIEGCLPHEEDGWAGRRFRVGEAVVEIGGPVPRCATTTHDPSTGLRDFDALRAIVAYRGRRNGRTIDFGVYAYAVQPGRVRVRDALVALQPAASREVASCKIDTAMV
jgi:uncharacterized protein YcbX